MHISDIYNIYIYIRNIKKYKRNIEGNVTCVYVMLEKY